MRRKNRFRALPLTLCLVLLLSLVACSGQSSLTETSSKPETKPTGTLAQTNLIQTYPPTPSPTVPATPTLAKPALTNTIKATASPTINPLPEGWQRDWLQGKPCQLPCWEWIQPGATNVDEAVVMLKQNPQVDAWSIKFEGGLSDYNSVYWKWRGQQYGGNFSYAAKTESKLLKDILIDLKGSFKLKEIIQAFGEPSHINATGIDSIENPGYFYGLDLIWEEQGLRMPFFHGELSPPDMTPELTTYWASGYTPILIVTPGNLSNFKFGGYADTIKLWQGFKPFGFYCLDYHSGKPCP